MKNWALLPFADRLAGSFGQFKPDFGVWNVKS